MTDSLAIRVATVLILVPFSVQSKICKIDYEILSYDFFSFMHLYAKRGGYDKRT